MSKIVVIGGSAGAPKALRLILAELPEDFAAAVLIATHVGAHSSMLPDILGRSSALQVRHAIDGEPILAGRVLVAPPNQHLTVASDDERSYVRLLHGPKENHCRPAIDPLFRSAAAAFRMNTIGIILSGYLDDGTVGLQAIKARGGIAIAQDPADAEAPDMPSSALQHVEIDRTLTAIDIGKTLVELVGAGNEQSNVPDGAATPGGQDWVDIENRLIGSDSDMDDLERIGRRSALTCPECDGALWELNVKGPSRYRCHTGHAFTANVLATLQSNAVEEALWGAIRALHEQERLFNRMRDQELHLGHHASAAEHQARAAQAKAQSQALRDAIASAARVVKPQES